jgi:hypothetical protein
MNANPLQVSSGFNEESKNIHITFNFEEFRERIEALKKKFSRLADLLEQAAREARDPGEISPQHLMEEMMEGQRNFVELRSKVLEVGSSFQLPGFSENGGGTLKALEAMVDALAELEEKRKFYEEVRSQVLFTLERVLSIVHRDGIDFPPLAKIKSQAKELRLAIMDSNWMDGQREEAALTKSGQAFSDLLTLVESAEELEDERWGLLHEAVEEKFGKKLAIAAARGKLRLGEESPRKGRPQGPKEPEDSAPEPSPSLSPSPSPPMGKEEILEPQAKETTRPVPPDPVGVKIPLGKEMPPQRGISPIQSARKEIRIGNAPPLDEKSESILEFLQKLTNSLQGKKKS